MQSSGSQYLPLQPPLQPPLPPQPRPQIPAFSRQVHLQMGPTSSFHHPSGPQLHHSQQMFHVQGLLLFPGFHFLRSNHHFQISLRPHHRIRHLRKCLSFEKIQAGGPHIGMEFNQVGSSKPSDRGSSWIPGLAENTVAVAPTLRGHPSFSGQMGPTNQPHRTPPLTPEMEKALLQQVMSLTPEQINMLPVDQRNQVLQLQQMLRQ